MKLITVQTFDNYIDAHLYRSKLESEKIQCYLVDEHYPERGVKLKVKDSDASKALKIFEGARDLEVKYENNNTVQCPNCGSTKLYYGYNSTKDLKGVLVGILSMFIPVAARLLATVYKCEKCCHEFK